jgi:tetratricopeptide (TPR) repeat protein
MRVRSMRSSKPNIILIFTLTFALFVLGSPLSGQDRISELEAKLKSAPNDESVLMELGKMYHDLGAAGNDKAVDRAFEIFGKALTLDSSNVVALAYRGSLWTLRARSSWWPPNKLTYLKRGGDDLDEAVSMDPGNIMVRLIRGISGMGLPGFLGRLPKSLEDFIVILRHPEFPEQRKELKVVVFYYAGLACKRADDYEKARDLFKKALSVFPGSEFARKAEVELKDMGS